MVSRAVSIQGQYLFKGGIYSRAVFKDLFEDKTTNRLLTAALEEYEDSGHNIKGGC